MFWSMAVATFLLAWAQMLHGATVTSATLSWSIAVTILVGAIYVKKQS